MCTDMHSKRHTLASACARVLKPGCVMHLIVITVGVDEATATSLQQLCAPKHCTLHSVDSTSEITQAFHWVKQQLVAETTTVTTTTQRQATKGAVTKKHMAGGKRT